MKFNIARRTKDRTVPGAASLDTNSDTLSVNCRGCERNPDVCSADCISCICEAISANGTAERIRLVSSKDTEISGGTADIICSLANVRRPVVVTSSGSRCARCAKCPDAVFAAAWADFPNLDFVTARSMLISAAGDAPECTPCMQRTFNALAASEKDMDAIAEKAKKLRIGSGVCE